MYCIVEKKLSYCIVVMVLYWFQENYKQWHSVVFGTILKNRKKPTTQYNIITQYNLVKFKVFLQKLYFVIVLYCIVFKKTINGSMNSITPLCCFWNNKKKTEKTTTTQYNTITQYKFVQFKGFLWKLYCVIVLYCVHCVV